MKVKKGVIILAMCFFAAFNTFGNMENYATNPLLGPFGTPYETVPFDKIKPRHFQPAFKASIKDADREFKALINQKDAPTFENTLLPFEEKSEELTRLGMILFNLNSAETNPEIQAATQKVSPILTKFMGKLMLNKKFFRRVEAIYNQRNETQHTPEEIRLIETTYQTMKRNGADLGFFKKFRLIALQMNLSKLNLKFNENILSETNGFVLHITDENELAGLPEADKEAAALAAKSKGMEGWIFTLHYPSYGPFMKFSDNREHRETLYMAYLSRGNQGNSNDNKKLIHKIVNLRLKQAQLLKYENYAQYVLEERMAENPEKVNQFLNELHNESRPVAEKELAELEEFAANSGFTEELMPWDFSYYSEKLKNNKFGFDEEMVKPYFKLELVIDGVFGLASKLYGLTFKQVNNISVYHPEVKTYEVLDSDGSFLAVLYADFFPREGKQGGAWMTEYRSQSNIKGQMKRPHISICCNFTKPTETQPSLLTFYEVNTFLHEFGHALHGMLANTVYPSLSGTNVYRDFVELPSQIMENWAIQIDWLKEFAVHYQTGEAMPEELLNKLIAAKNFQTGYATQRQLSFAISDMAWHTLTNPFKDLVVLFERKITEKTRLLPYVEGTSFSTSFSHIFAGGYASGYYGYKWAEVLDADAFSLFEENGIFDKETAKRFRTEILEKGGTVHPMELYQNFRGAEPSIEPLLIRSGLRN